MRLAAQIARLGQEIDQISAAVSVVGTRRSKLLELADAATAIANKLHGDRPEVRRMVTAIRQRVHDVRTSRSDQSAASALRDLGAELTSIVRKVEDGIGDTEAFIKVSPGLVVGNTWGYTEAEMARVVDPLTAYAKKLEAWGLDPGVFTVVLDPSWSGDSRISLYDKDWETLVLVPNGAGSVKLIASDIGRALWIELFSAKDREPWGDDPERFIAAFSAAVVGDTMSGDDAVRLRVTMHPWAPKWPERP